MFFSCATRPTNKAIGRSAGTPRCARNALPRPSMKQLAGRPGITVTGRVPHDRVAGWIAACDLLCQPSEREPFGIAALEALALGKPVVVSTNGGAAEFVPPEAGIVVDPVDAGVVTEAIERALALPSADAAARAAAERHSAEAEALRLAELLTSVA